MILKIASFFNAMLLLAMFVISFILWGGLPDRIPIHYGLTGQPDHWVNKSLSSWLSLPGVAVGLTMLLYGASLLIRRYPKFVNMPKKEVFLLLPVEKKEPIFKLIKTFLYWICVPVNALWLSGQIGNYQVAIGISDRLPWHTLGILLGLVIILPIIVVTFLIRLNNEISKSASSPNTA